MEFQQFFEELKTDLKQADNNNKNLTKREDVVKMANKNLISALKEKKAEVFFPKFVLNVEETFPEGILFKDISLGYGFDQEKGQRTEDVESFKVTVMDVKTEEKITIKIPADAELPEDIMEGKNKPVRFINLLGGRLNKGYWFKADGIEFI